MAKNIIKSVETKGVGFAPILRFYFERCAIAETIDENVPLGPRRKVLTHGQAGIVRMEISAPTVARFFPHIESAFYHLCRSKILLLQIQCKDYLNI